jgi:nucleoside-diphosphate-sugar epimerase
MSKRILITGAAGYIGTTLIPHLLTTGGRWDLHIIAVDLYPNGPIFGDLCHDARFEPVRGDCRDKYLMRDLIKRADFIIPLAALVGAPMCAKDTEGAWSTNFGAIKTILDYASVEQRIVFPATNSGYGRTAAGVFCTEESPVSPVSVYGITKGDAEKMVLDRENTVSLRFATIFGMSRRMRLDLLVNEMVWRAVHDRAVVLFEADARRNFLHIRDAVDAILWVMDDHGRNPHNLRDCGIPNANLFNVGHPGANMTKRELCVRIAAKVPGFAPLEAPVGTDPDQRDYLVSSDRLARTGFRWDYTLEHGIEELIRGFKMMRRTEFGNA